MFYGFSIHPVVRNAVRMDGHAISGRCVLCRAETKKELHTQFLCVFV